MKNNQYKALLLGASVLGLTLAAAGPAHSQCTSTATGTQTRSVSVYCVDHKSRAMSSIGLTDAECDRWNHLATPGAKPSHATSQSCTYTVSVPCPPPPYSGDGGDGDGYGVDVDGDGDSDMSHSEAAAAGLSGPTVSGEPDGSYSSGGGSSGGGGGGGGGDGCFVTTAVVDVIGETDDGPILTALRHLRDAYTIHNYRGAERIRIYYDIAPKIVFKIENKNNSREIWQSVYKDWIVPIRSLIDQRRLEEADKKYSEMVLLLTSQYLLEDLNPEERKTLFLNVLRIL